MEGKRKATEDVANYAHSPAHFAVLQRDHSALRKIVAALPRLAKAGDVNKEAESLAAEEDADAVSAVIDRRDVPGRETPLHLAVRFHDATAAEILMSAGADWSLQNENGWSALQEAVCTREENIAVIIARHYQPLAWAKWCRRLPRIVASAARIRDFYMEITFHFESSVIPFIARIAPSDTYRIWKRGSNLRADMTLAGFDGFRIQRSDQTFLFLGEGCFWEGGNGSLPPGSLIVLSHKKKEISNALEGAGVQPSEAEVAREVAYMSQTNMYRPGIDVTKAELVPQLNWRRRERTETVGAWKAKVYDMLHVSLSVKSRRVPGAVSDQELFEVNDDDRIESGIGHDDYSDVLTTEERMQLDSALSMEDPIDLEDDEEPEFLDSHENCNRNSFESCESNVVTKERKSWFGWSKKGKRSSDVTDDSRIHKSNSNLALDDRKQRFSESCRSPSNALKKDVADTKKPNDNKSKRKKNKGTDSGSKNESEYKKGLRPVLWLTPDFPLKTEELLPLLDILANKVKAVRRLREVLTTTLPPGTFPVKIAIPVVPSIRVVVTFTKFEELQPAEEFSTPCSSPAHLQDAQCKDSEASSWISWMKGSSGEQLSDGESCSVQDEIDPFEIPSDYRWIDANEKKQRMKAKKAKNKKHKKPAAAKNLDRGQQSKKDIKD